MKKILIVGLSIIGLFLLLGAGRKFYLYDYEEVCVGYQQNVTAKIKYCYDVPIATCTESGNWTRCNYDWGNTTRECEYSLRYIQTDNCLEYKLVRKIDIKPFNYLFDWCRVYPDSKECS